MTDRSTVPSDEPPRNALGETPTRVAVRRVVILFIVIACIAGLALAVRQTRRGDEAVTLTGAGESDPVVELLTPQSGSTLVNQQSQVGIDLTTPYTAALIINGVPIPDDQLLKRPELSAIYFTPGAGKIIEQLPAGQTCAQAIITRVDGTAETVNPVSWCFGVA